MKKIPIKVFDFYLRFSFIADILLSVVLIFFLDKKELLLIPENNILQTIYSNTISTSVSIIGFGLAVLTIIVTFKTNIKAKLSDEDFEKLNGLELILSSSHYKSIVRLFRKVLYEVTFIFIILNIFFVFQNNFIYNNLFYILIYSIISISFALLRTLIVLFKILNLDKYN
uniref:hypothetical protein n=1 Tax=Pedobacter schmidteae TaxID=2201271 RepID=UPI000EB463DC|nr:hypothetical protein [Pedobacter schmidteae]